MYYYYVQQFTSYFGVQSADLPIVYLINTAKDADKKMSKTQEVTERGVAQLIEDWRAGSADSYQPNTEQATDEEWESEHVITLTAEDYERVTRDPSTTTFVMWYRPSCPHCKSSRALWEDLAKKYAEHPTLKIAQIKSSHASKIPELGLKKVPTMLLYKGAEEKIEWEGEKREIEDWEAFLVEHVFNVDDTKKDEL